jgi:hypothetical protein
MPTPNPTATMSDSHHAQCTPGPLATEYASKNLEEMGVGFTKIVNGKAVTRWTVNRWEVGTFAKSDAMNLTETLVELGFNVE